MPRKNKKLPRHLLVIRTSAMGDVAMLPHALRALKEAYPEVKVTVATKSLFHPFFEGVDVDFLDIETRRTHRGIRGAIRFAREAAELKIDAVADMHNVLRSKMVRAALHLRWIPVSVIHKGRIEKYMRLGRGSEGVKPLKHTVIRYCDVFRRLGFDFPDPRPAEKRPRPNPMGEKRGVWIGFAPFSAQPGKTYPEKLSAEAVRLLSGRFDRVFVHSGGGEEAEFARRMEALYPNVTALYGKIKLGDEMNLISNLDCVVSMDSLVMHLASLMATPTVSVWGATHPGLGFLGYGFGQEGVLQTDFACRPCSVYGKKPCKYGDYRCIWSIEPQMILDRVERLVGKTE